MLIQVNLKILIRIIHTVRECLNFLHYVGKKWNAA